MKCLSASIIVLAGMVSLVGGSFVAHDQTATFLQIVGAVVAAAGLYVWFRVIQPLTE